MRQIRMLDTVALLEDLPQQGLLRGQVGTIVERRKDGAFEIEFRDLSGKTYAFATMRADQVLKLNYPKTRNAESVQYDSPG